LIAICVATPFDDRRALSLFITPDGTTKTNTQQYKIKKYTKHKRIIKTIKSESEYASKARPNSLLNIDVAGMPGKT